MKAYTEKQLKAAKKHTQKRLKKVKRHGSAWIAYRLCLEQIRTILAEIKTKGSVRSSHEK